MVSLQPVYILPLVFMHIISGVILVPPRHTHTHPRPVYWFHSFSQSHACSFLSDCHSFYLIPCRLNAGPPNKYLSLELLKLLKLLKIRKPHSPPFRTQNTIPPEKPPGDMGEMHCAVHVFWGNQVSEGSKGIKLVVLHCILENNSTQRFWYCKAVRCYHTSIYYAGPFLFTMNSKLKPTQWFLYII